ncbi:Ribosomal protein S18 acetylase RimI [Cohaesibacter marisflavi]|uniref:Ribosomal protein S18 acetylase RimI n=1 Tax=Cohaesibacter marisflavi TaxID=655353 RepID=A0A1I5EF19_9HYPH|nr:GNAT family N-acetyltransferase [Cohaesibacter marisflavi]SFO09691.1 Ribosomal protein S18 acetylase RimI [Cohaesibacter marisflavi]
MAIRVAKQDDAGALAALSIEVWLHTYCRPGIPPVFAAYAQETFTPDNMAALIADKDQHLLVDGVDYAGQEGLRGYLRWSCPSKRPLPACPAAEIDTLYVRERHKGQGIGTTLLEASYADMRKAGHDAAFLVVNAENEEAVSYYLRKGFKTLGESWFEIEDGRYLNFVMQKEFGI